MMRFLYFISMVLGTVLAMQVVASGSALAGFCTGYFDIVSFKCLHCPSGYDIDKIYSANSSKLCKKKSEKTASYSYDTKSVFKACKSGTFANFGSTKCYKCSSGYSHDVSKKVETKGVCYYQSRKPASKKEDLTGALTAYVGKELAKCDSAVKALFPVLPFKAFSKSFYKGKLKVRADGKFAGAYSAGFACEFPKQLSNIAAIHKKLGSYGLKDMYNNYKGTCKERGVGLRELCALTLPLEKGVKKCLKAFKPDQFVDFFKAVYKETKSSSDSLTIDMTKLAGAMGKDSAQAIILAMAGSAKISKGKLEKLIKARLIKAGVSPKVVNRVAKAKKVVEAYKKAMKAQNACAI